MLYLCYTSTVTVIRYLLKKAMRNWECWENVEYFIMSSLCLFFSHRPTPFHLTGADFWLFVLFATTNINIYGLLWLKV